jgi:alternate signal-mediated exported protein
MNKAFKGAVVGAAGVALLAGGFGTFATWTDSKTIDAGTVKSGELRIEPITEDPTWHEGAAHQAAAVRSDFSTDELVMVPGDVFTMRQPLDVTATGRNLKAELTVTGVDWTPGAGFDDSLSVTVKYAGKSYTLPGGSAVLNWKTSQEMADLNGATAATVTFAYADRPGGNEQTGWALDMRKTTLTLQQTR